MEYKLVSPVNEEDWKTYHSIRRRVLFEARGRFGLYRDDHPDERAPRNFPKILNWNNQPIATVRIDLLPSNQAILRMVAVEPNQQRKGHGRVLLELAEEFARDAGMTELLTHAANDAVGFYEAFGFSEETWDEDEVDEEHTQLSKLISEK